MHTTATYLEIWQKRGAASSFGDDWKRIPFRESSAIGRDGAAGALEAIVAAETCRTELCRRRLILTSPMSAVSWTTSSAQRDAGAERVLSVSFGMGGQNAALILQRVTA